MRGVRKSEPAPATAAGSIDLSKLDALTGFVVRMVQLRLFQQFHQRFGGTGLSPGVVCALVAIGANPGIRAGMLGDALLIKRSNMTKLVDALERQGLVRRLPSDEDRRSVELSLTDKGHRRVAEVMPAFIEHEEAALAPLTVHERRILVGLLGKLNDGMSGMPSPRT
jgi:DNA-binding MarR family transcriptional regulator